MLDNELNNFKNINQIYTNSPFLTGKTFVSCHQFKCDACNAAIRATLQINCRRVKGMRFGNNFIAVNVCNFHFRCSNRA